ncbi:MAG TPA: hypothetical protein PLD25_03110 [Chloroflexota bacterium]|nr:hypothetical protein [Chloroflexota bacterium]HUM71930.1 hypothetical protein [Chloroflexota bacterium]
MNEKSGKRPLRPHSVQALRHHSFILSLWPEGGALPNAPPVWRYSLEDPHTAVRHGFKDLVELAAFLEEWTAVPPE